VGDATFALAVLFGAAALPQAAGAQVAGGSEAGAGPPLGANSALLSATATPPAPQCIHRTVDLRRGTSLDDNRLTVWLSVHQPQSAVIKASGSANSLNTGTFAITLLRDGIPIGNSAVSRGTAIINAEVGASVKLVPGQQYKISAKALVTNKRLDLFDLYVGMGEACP
jgi:hypothetical protein